MQPKAGQSLAQNQDKLNTISPGAAEAQLGDRLAQLAANINALLAHLDAANVAGIGNTNGATFGVAAINAAVPNPPALPDGY